MNIITRANTLKLSRPEVWEHTINIGDEIDALYYNGWYVLGDTPPNYLMPAKIRATFNQYVHDGMLVAYFKARYPK